MAPTPSLDRPIVVLGAARSGTKVLAKALSAHADVAYWVEPNYVWKWSHGSLRHDMLGPQHATADVVEYIRGRFADHTRSAGRTRFAEKTPANTLRPAFVHRVLPEARFVHIVRDGREVALSARMRWEGRLQHRREAEAGRAPADAPLRHRARRRLGRREIPLRDLPYYLVDFARPVATRLGLRGVNLWGPVFPGMRTLRRQYSLLEVCALQWRASVETVGNYVASQPDGLHLMEVRYEDLCDDPRRVLGRVYDFVELDPPPSLDQLVADIEPRQESWGRAMDDAEARAIGRLIDASLERLGYRVPTVG